MDFKLLGSILLVVGSAIGAGMLALPIATAELGFIASLILLVACWAVMTLGALFLLEVNLWMPQNSNLISMAKATIGPLGQLIAWITYLLLLYSLLCAYIAGGSDLLHRLLEVAHVNLPLWLTACVFTLLFGSIVYIGIRAIDYANRGLMLAKFLSYGILILLLTPFIEIDKLMTGSIKKLGSAVAIMVTITSFGSAIIVPSLRVYFAGDVRKLRIAIIAGSLIPLICYMVWDAAIMGILPLDGTQGLSAILHSGRSTSDLVAILSSKVAQQSITLFVKLFTSICVLTSFLGVSLCLTDFLADGFGLEKKGGGNVFIQVVTFLPPLTLVLFFPGIFIKALEYAGIYCLVLLVLLPAYMAWSGRYRKKIAKGYRVWGGKYVLLGLMMVSLGLIMMPMVGS